MSFENKEQNPLLSGILKADLTMKPGYDTTRQEWERSRHLQVIKPPVRPEEPLHLEPSPQDLLLIIQAAQAHAQEKMYCQQTGLDGEIEQAIERILAPLTVADLARSVRGEEEG